MPKKEENGNGHGDPGEYSFEVRFGSAAIAQGVVPIPRIVVDHYALLGVKDREMMWVIHILAYKWTSDNPFPKRKRFRCEKDDPRTQRRRARPLRELGLLFTTRKYRHGRMVSLIYDLDSLLHNCVRIYEQIEEEAKRHLVRAMIDPELASKYQWESAREQVLDRVARGYKVELPPDVMARLKAGEYDDVAPPWDRYAPQPDPDPEQMEGQQLFDHLFPPPDAGGLGIQTNSGDPDENSAVPVEAGGADSASAIVLDGICQWNGLADRKSMPEKKRLSQQRRIAAIIGQWGGATPEQAKLAWEAWTIRIAWPAVVNPFSTDWENKWGFLLSAVKDGSITEEGLRQEARDAGIDMETTVSDEVMAILQRRKQRAIEQQEAYAKRVPAFWRITLSELQLQMTAATFDSWLRDSTAKMSDGTVTVHCKNEYAVDWLGSRLHDVILHTIKRTIRNDVREVIFVVEPEPEPEACPD